MFKIASQLTELPLIGTCVSGSFKEDVGRRRTESRKTTHDISTPNLRPRVTRRGRPTKKFLFLALVLFLIGYTIYWNEDTVKNFLIQSRSLFDSIPDSKMPANCLEIIKGNASEIIRAKFLPHKEYPPSHSADLPSSKYSCTEFKKRRRYILNATKEELDFPIAFSIITYRNIHQLERLLRAIYRPHNYYCIHVDRKSDMLPDVQRLLQCFDNVFLSSMCIPVEWGTFSVLEADLLCMKDLLAYKKWKYFINLTGQEFPLKTNYQIVQILKAFNGANNVAGTLTRYNENRRRWIAGPPPHGLRPVMGYVHIAVNRQFVDFAINNPVAQDLAEWVRQTLIPDETFFATLNYNPQLGIPGTHRGVPNLEPYPIRFKNWDHGALFFLDDCKGKYVREICILGVGDVPSLVTQKHIIANKFHQDFQPAALDCIEEWYFNMIKEENQGHRNFDTAYYSGLDFVINQVHTS